MTLRADELVHTQSDNTAKATGNVKILRGNRFEGPQLRLALDTLEGRVRSPHLLVLASMPAAVLDLIEFHGSNHRRQPCQLHQLHA